MSRFVTVGKEGSVSSSRAKRVFSRDRRIAVFNDEGTLRAVDDICTHVGASLSEGLCEYGVVTCPWHGGQFRLADGQGLGPPAYRRLQTYSVRVRSGIIEVEIDRRTLRRGPLTWRDRCDYPRSGRSIASSSVRPHPRPL